ncbi:MAG TPA: GNAT family N-acetyltransferase [Tepidisphaeraceae bacterium]|jgi:RimJ/RimL family protein N-acetyltransferase|nr:GNAT family N-acetyltransferase [Tepidisphaeraceae bacterium]
MNPLLLEIPSKLSSERLLLRVPAAGDGAVTYPSVRDSLNELKQWMPWATDDYAEQSGEEWCRKSAAEFLSRKQLQFLIFSHHEGRHLGNIGAFKFDWDVPSCEIGYWLHTAHTGHGYMTEAVGVLRNMLYQTLGARRVQICTDEKNHKSRRVAELAGFQLEGVLRNDCIAVGGRLRNTCVFSWIGQ